ncbi:MAG: SelT/SelW/SelH family protein [Verrucomicrobiota bacterium]
MKPVVEIEYCPGCRWLLRAGWTAQELLTTFEKELGSVALRPSEISGRFTVWVDGVQIWDRKEEARFPEMKELKQRLRDQIAPERDLGHSDVTKTSDGS